MLVVVLKCLVECYPVIMATVVIITLQVNKPSSGLNITGTKKLFRKLKQ